jgi:anthranilate 1,2-dioxygenase small subunit
VTTSMQHRLDRKVLVLDLLARYVEVLDSKRLEEWPGLFADEASYIVTTRENEELGLPLAVVCDDTKDRIFDRVSIIREFWKDHFNDQIPRHILGPTFIEGDGPELVARTNFVVYLTKRIDGSTLLFPGEYRDTFSGEGEEIRFREKRVVLDTPVLPDAFVYPL